MHGPYGEDGAIQGLLEMIGLAYVGAGVGASAVGMNKVYCKSILQAANLPVLPWTSANRTNWVQGHLEVIETAEKSFRYPIFVKPANMGSSVGINRSRDRGELQKHVEIALCYDDYVLLERGIEAREIEVSVLGGFEPDASVPGEIIPADDFYSYEAKYLKEGSRLLIPAPLGTQQTRELQELAIAVFKVLQLEGMARVDFLVDKKSEEIWVNEPNTIPGFTEISMYPKLWEATGLSFPHLLEQLILIAGKRHQRRSRLSVER
jgi:D-alanine-D-alanine ligase